MMNRSSSLSLRGAGLSTLTVLAAISLVLGGCVDDSQIGGEGGNNGGTTTGTQGTTTGGGGTANCPSYPDEASLGTATFSVKNNRAVPIYISAGTCGDQFFVSTSPGGDIHRGSLDAGELTCSTKGSTGIAPDCIDGTVLEIKAGETKALGWDGHVYESHVIADECATPEMLSNVIGIASCNQAKAFPAGSTSEVSLFLFDSAECTPQNCAMPTGQFTAKKTFAFPGDTQVQIDVN